MKRYFILLIFFSFVILSLFSQNEVLQLFDGKTYKPVLWDKVESIQYNEEGNILKINTEDEIINVDVKDGFSIPSGQSIPLIEIFTDEYLEEVPNKIDYKSGNFFISCFGAFDDHEQRVEIRGRGNSSWGFEKKPYRLKFDKKISLCGLPKAKSYVLLANYTDNSLIQNALAFKIGELLELPYTPVGIPVDLKLNGIYKGSYLLTNKPGINSGSVDIAEDKSVMWELDVTYDEDLKFKSPLLDLPVMVADPDLTETQFEYWKNDFIDMEKAVVNLNASEFIDIDLAARYLLVFEIMKNDEIGFPKSVKLFKSEGEKYIFGPIWDFDTAMGKVWNGPSYTTDNIEDRIWKNALFSWLEKDAFFIESINNHWSCFRTRLPELIDFVDKYYEEIKQSGIRNQQIWSGLEDFETCRINLVRWLTMRFAALDRIYIQ